tara:strand:+ start:1150 stop:1398 length:249 start_codon:yes stop_codon:yes gene_type:complete
MKKDEENDLTKKGKEFLKKLRAAPYNNDIAGNSFIRKVSKQEESNKRFLKPGGKFYELFKDIPFNNSLAGKSFIRKVSKKKI